MDALPANLLPEDLHAEASLVGRVWNPDVAGLELAVCIRDNEFIDITSADAPTMRDLLERDDPAGSCVTVTAYCSARSISLATV